MAKKILLATLLFGLGFWLVGMAKLQGPAIKSADAILGRIETDRGICVVLADAKCGLAIELAKKSQLLIYVQLAPDQDLETARKAADAAGLYGTRIYVEKGPLSKIHLGDNLADVVIVADKKATVSEAEVLRVLNPLGKALIGNKELTKPFPEGIDDWSHPYHAPDNNPLSQDQIARGPYLTQFLAGPRYAPLTQVAVASAGRVFKAFGNIAFKEREEPFLNSLVAFNGYNGTILWRRKLAPGYVIHRNTIIATPDTLYVGDDKSCKLIDTATGRLKDEIIPPTDIAGGTFWKWMGMENGVLYALTGQQEQKDPVMRWRMENRHGWPWSHVSKGYNQPNGKGDGLETYDLHPWGFGRNVLAIDPKTKKVLWSHRETEPVDSRAMCMKNGRIYIFRFSSYLACLNAKTGSTIWRKTPENAPELFEAIGTYLNRQSARYNWRTACYLKCSDKALYFAGPQIDKLLAVSAEDGSVLWQHPYNNFQLVLRDDGLYGISGGRPWMDKFSKKFDPLTGQILTELPLTRRGCTRPIGSVDAIFFRACEGTSRFDLASGVEQWISPMRAQCQDGVTIANGHLYWWPQGCDCIASIFGITCLGPAGDFEFNQQASETDRLKTFGADLTKVASLSESDSDWPTFRADNQAKAVSKATISQTSNVDVAWQLEPKSVFTPTAPVTAGGLTFFGASDGIVRAVDAASGNVQWKAYTGGAVRFPPTIWKGRAYVGSGDGYVYCFEAKTGRLLWKFRAAPAKRKIPVYGTLLSTWPAASGVLVKDSTAYVAAGILNYDGTHLYALDAVTGKIKWQNNTTGHLYSAGRTGISVQGQMLINAGKLYLAGGTSLSPAIYDITNGQCLSNDTSRLKTGESTCPRGWELSLLGDEVLACGEPFYSHPDLHIPVTEVSAKLFVSLLDDISIAWIDNKKIMCVENVDKKLLNEYVQKRRKPKYIGYGWGPIVPPDFEKPVWQYDCPKSTAIAVSKNAVIIAEPSKVLAKSLKNGRLLWSQPIPSPTVPWGLAIDRSGRVIAALKDGSVMCFAQSE